MVGVVGVGGSDDYDDIFEEEEDLEGEEPTSRIRSNDELSIEESTPRPDNWRGKYHDIAISEVSLEIHLLLVPSFFLTSSWM